MFLILSGILVMYYCQDPALISNETNYEPYELISAVNGSIMWAAGETSIPANSSDSIGALLGYVSS